MEVRMKLLECVCGRWYPTDTRPDKCVCGRRLRLTEQEAADQEADLLDEEEEADIQAQKEADKE